MAEKKVLGFQFEPRKIRVDRPGEESEPDWESCYDSDIDNEVNEQCRGELPVNAWCKCGPKCVAMPTEIENLCCHELEGEYVFSWQEGMYLVSSVMLWFCNKAMSCKQTQTKRLKSIFGMH